MAFGTIVQRVLGASRSQGRNARIAAAAWDTLSPYDGMRQCKIITGAYKASRQVRRVIEASRCQGGNARIDAAAWDTRSQCKIIAGDYKILRQAAGMPLLPTCLMEKLQRRILHPTPEVKLMVKHALHLLKLARIRMRLEQIREVQISNLEFFCICLAELEYPTELTKIREEIAELAKILKESGSLMFCDHMVIVGEQEVESIKKRVQELENLEKQKSIIDENALSLVQRELWFVFFALVGGRALGALPSWKSLLFFSYSFYLIGKIIFFMRTKKEPTLEAFFESRLKMKQEQVIGVEDLISRDIKS